MPEEQVLTEWLNEESPQYKRKAIEEGRAFLNQHELPWTLIVDNSNYYQETEERARTWLSTILERINQSLNQDSQADAFRLHT